MKWRAWAAAALIVPALAGCATAPGNPGAPSGAASADFSVPQSLIDATEGGAAAFEVVDPEHIRHRQSGMLCRLPADMLMKMSRLIVFPAKTVGEDVACDYVLPDGKLTLYATRRDGLPLEAYAQGTFNSMHQSFPDGVPTETTIATVPGFDDPLAQSLGFTRDGRAYVTSALVAREGRWFITLRATYPADMRKTIEILPAVITVSARQAIRNAAQP